MRLAISTNVYLTQSNTQSFRIEASDKITALLETEVKNGLLTIKWSKNKVRHSEKIKIYISMKEVAGLAISGSADIEIAGTQTANSLSIAISGSGDVKASELQVKNLKTKISGSGNCKVNVFKRLDATISGSGNVYYKGRPIINGKLAGSERIKSIVTIQLT